MPHIFCPDEKCRRIIHLDGQNHWDYEGEVTCKRCGTRMEVEIEEGQVRSKLILERGKRENLHAR